MKLVTFAQHDFILHHRGVLIWPSEKIGIVSDLHLEKGSHFGMRGQMIPPHDSIETLQNLINILEFSDVKTLILLGDSFHDEDGYNRLQEQGQNLFKNLCKTYDVLWIIGNHDGGFIPCNVVAADEKVINDIVFRHEADPQSGAYEISGHFHPKLSIKLKENRVSRACFVHDDRRMILPSFGTYTGGLDVTHDAIKTLFVKPQYHMIGQNQIYSINDQTLKRTAKSSSA